MTQTGQKNRVFSQIGVGAIVAFDNPVVCNVVAGRGYQIFQQAENRYGKWFMLSGGTEYASEAISPKSWEMDGGYIISQPGEVLAEPDQASLQKTQISAGQNSAVRTRDEQIRYFLDICEDGALTQQAPTTDFIFRMLLEAEARGAEEQRRKDAEGQEPFAYVSQEDANTPKNVQGLEQFGEYCDKKYEYFQVPLYTRPANVAALEARIAELEAEKADAGWTFLAGNMSGDPRLPSCRLSRLFQEGDTFSRFKQSAEEFGIEVILKSDEREEEEWDEELSAEMLSRLDQYEHLIADGWSFVDVWDDEDSNIVRLFARPIRASLTREGGV
ncbi:hypothetical protein [Gluconobacter oxydans]|uniref:hypothetical protein n=1 Tax=Gluconobacter oxydans TaxID=442 RepID=UPI003464ACF9